MLVRQEDRSDFKRALWNWINAQADWNEFRLDGFCEQELSDWPTGDKPWSIVSRRTHYYDLTAIRDSSAEPLASLGSKTRSVIRQNLRRLGPVTTQWAESIAEGEEIFAGADPRPAGTPTGCLVPMRARSSANSTELLHRLLPLGLMGLFRVRGPQGTIGCR